MYDSSGDYLKFNFDFETFLAEKISESVSNLKNGIANLICNDSEKERKQQGQKSASNITFDVKAMLENACNAFALGSYAIKDYPTDITTDGLVAASKYAGRGKGLNNLGATFAFINLGFDAKKALSTFIKATNPTNEYDRVFGKWNATFDCLTTGCDVFGFVSPETAMMSIPLSSTIQGVKFASEEGAIYSVYKEKNMINEMSQYKFGVNIK